jgi:DNA-binding winged helix-turn-helix (wHTH) protein
MALKNLSVLDSNLGSYSNETQRDCDQGGLNTQTCGAALFEEPVLPSLAEQPHRHIQPEQFENNDYQIALVPRKNGSDRTGSILQPSTKTDRVLLLPLTWRELLDGVRREFNHSSSAEQSMIMRFGEVRVDFLTMEISRSEKPIALTPQAFKLLRFFTQSPERVISRNELLNEVWGYKNYPSTRTVDNHICMLRQKLELNPARPIHFLTVSRIGYRFVP